MDAIRGKVTRVIDGDTFEMTVTYRARNNEYAYNNTERVRIEGIDAPELNTPAGIRAQVSLAQKIRGKNLQVDVVARDVYRRVVGSVKVI